MPIYGRFVEKPEKALEKIRVRHAIRVVPDTLYTSARSRARARARASPGRVVGVLGARR